MGVLTAIQRFSLHDGPGIRTTVFFKGCNMACAWCHNPETLSMRKQLHVYPDKCMGCGACVAVCPVHARTLEEGKLTYDRAACIQCGQCAGVCFSGALDLSGMEKDAKAVMEEVLQDKAYYDRSGGGVTLSGGEVFMQPEFAGEILVRCREEGISTAVETNMNVPFSHIEPLLHLIDLVMLDVKLMDGALHKKWTGVDNGRILSNIRKLDQRGLPMIARTPVIPGVNDNEREISAIARFVSTLQNVKYYELLNFNPLGESKYLSLDMPNPFRDAKPLSEERLKILQDAAASAGLTVRLG